MEYPFDNFYQILEKNALRSASHTIIYEHELHFTNKQFKAEVDRLAHFLHQHNIKRGDKVAIVMANCWQFIAVLFAASKIGAVPIPVNNFLKEDELAYILNDAQAKILFSSFKFAPETKDLLIKTAIEKIVWVAGCPAENTKNIDFAKIGSGGDSPTYTAKLDDDALIVYTSGTTGKPKGAILSFRGIFSNCRGTKELMKLKDGQIRMLSYLPMFHAFSLTATVMLPIYSNSAVIIIRSISNKKDFKYLLGQLLLKRCRYFTGIPDIYSAMARAKLPWYFHWFHNVTGFISGAAPLPEEVSKRFSQSFKRGMLLEGYGISECSPVVSCNTPENNRQGSVGQPLAGYQVKIFDENMHELPLGEIGEICVKGDCVMKGYYNRPDATAEAIVNGWFKTGDLGKVDADNFIYIVDRKKDLIIHKGMNIYPREIEEILYTNPKVGACAVIGVQDSQTGEIPVAYIEVKEDSEKPTESELKEFLKPFLASFKIPRKIYFIDKLPKNATGKVLKRELRQLVL